MATRDELVAMNSKQLEEICGLIQKECPLAKQVRHSCTNFYPNVCFVVVDALNPQDYPNGIGDNSIFLMFRVDFEQRRWSTSVADISTCQKKISVKTRSSAIWR